jgi:membrane protein implicated in regulation of membrane protease activity
MKRDLRNYARQTNLRLIAGALLILLIVGEGLIFIIYGPGAAVTGLLCVGAGLFPVILIVLIFFGIDWIIKRANRE